MSTTAGTLQITLLEGNLFVSPSLWQSSTDCNPYVIFTIGKDKETARSRTIYQSAHPIWSNEHLTLTVPHLANRKVAENSNIRVPLAFTVHHEDSLAHKAGEYIGVSNGTVLGKAAMDLTPLIEGKQEIIDVWVPIGGAAAGVQTIETLENRGERGERAERTDRTDRTEKGELHFLITYRPCGLTPEKNDLVQFLGYGMYPSSLLPPLETTVLRVIDCRGPYLLLTTQSKRTKHPLQLRCHRNGLYVVQRTNWYHHIVQKTLYEPLAFVQNTPLGKTIGTLALPYYQLISSLSLPFIQTAKLMLTTSSRVSYAALRAVISEAASEG